MEKQFRMAQSLSSTHALVILFMFASETNLPVGAQVNSMNFTTTGGPQDFSETHTFSPDYTSQAPSETTLQEMATELPSPKNSTELPSPKNSTSHIDINVKSNVPSHPYRGQALIAVGATVAVLIFILIGKVICQRIQKKQNHRSDEMYVNILEDAFSMAATDEDVWDTSWSQSSQQNSAKHLNEATKLRCTDIAAIAPSAEHQVNLQIYGATYSSETT